MQINVHNNLLYGLVLHIMAVYMKDYYVLIMHSLHEGHCTVKITAFTLKLLWRKCKVSKRYTVLMFPTTV